MLLYRITHKAFSHSLFAPGFSGRWNSDGKKVIYTAESIALAFVESMLRRQGSGFNRDFNTMVIEVPDTLLVTHVELNALPSQWRSAHDYRPCQQIGDKWYDRMVSPMLKVPSAVLPEAYNYVINTLHPDFAKIKLLHVTGLIPDDRIEQMLKK
ncbi:RES family NAD+ phosphorylase [Parapedobacter tibetensis]|uniref:RES family NAD+ phosphorylase n=1 Tax=Parapedobacter tibetensis TaxID=2972951 RepID=UPI00214D7DCA|nr:RES family NAD+ phosphorylase [Parapedobacter tibetensis]